MRGKIILTIILCFNILASTLATVYAEPETVGTTSPAPHAEAAILLDMKSGKVLYNKNENEKMYPASITKIMTAILTLESGIDFSEVITASADAINPITNKHSHMGILVGENLTVENLIYGMLVYSANDAANVLAIRIAGSLDAFVQMMNDKAIELGATNTHFANAHGFHDDNHYTTASDIALIARYAMQNETFRQIVKTDMYTMEATNKYRETRYLSSTNHLISRRRQANYYYKKAIGIKTGYTDESGYCLAAAAVDGDTELLSVVLNCHNITEDESGLYSFIDTRSLFEYGFDNFKYIIIAANGTVVADSSVYEAKDNIRVTLTPKNDIGNILPIDIDMNEVKGESVINEEIAAPIKKGDVLGSITYTYKGEEIGTSELVAVNDVKKDYIIATIHLVIKTLTHPIFIILVLLILYLRFTAKNRRKRRRKNRRSKLKHVRQ